MPTFLIHHLDLAGLNADDHPQYLHRDGRRALSDTWDAGSFPILASQLTASETSAAPLQVTSTTKVDNLNGDLLDGEGDTFLRNVGNLNAGNLPFAQLPDSGGVWTANPTITSKVRVTGNLTVNDTSSLRRGLIFTSHNTGTHVGSVSVNGIAVLVNSGGSADTTTALTSPDTGQIVFFINSDTTFAWAINPLSVTLAGKEGAIARYNGTSWDVIGSST
jgi:hypothetical protein